jgi:hypothetical protein
MCHPEGKLLAHLRAAESKDLRLSLSLLVLLFVIPKEYPTASFVSLGASINAVHQPLSYLSYD